MKTIVLIGAALLASNVNAAGGGAPLDQSTVTLDNRAALQRGARTFVNYCMGCHSAGYMLYSVMAEDLGLTEEQVEENFIFDPDVKIGGPMTSAMTEENARKWFGAPPPDLSVIARSRGPDWLYTFLRSYYADPSRPTGWNNTLFVGTSMPHVLWPLQGIQHLDHDGQDEAQEAAGHGAAGPQFVLHQEGQLSPRDYDVAVNELVSFLTYVGEPAKLERESLGIWVLLYLSLFTFLAYLLKVEYWRDVH